MLPSPAFQNLLQEHWSQLPSTDSVDYAKVSRDITVTLGGELPATEEEMEINIIFFQSNHLLQEIYFFALIIGKET